MLGWPAAGRGTAFYEDYQAAEEHLRQAELSAASGERDEARRRCSEAIRLLNAAVALRPESKERYRTYGIAFIEYFPYYQLGRAHECVGRYKLAIGAYETELAKAEILKNPQVSADLIERLSRLRAKVAPSNTPTRSPTPSPSPSPSATSPMTPRFGTAVATRVSPRRSLPRTRVPVGTDVPSPIRTAGPATATATPPAPTISPTLTPTPSPESTLAVRYDQPESGRFVIRFAAFHASGIQRAELFIQDAFQQAWDVTESSTDYEGRGVFDLPQGTYDARLVVIAADGSRVLQHQERLRSGTSAISPLLIALPVSVVSATAGSLFVRRRRRRRALARSFNPYIAGSPVIEEDMFFGRTELLQQVLNTLHNNSLLLFGERRIGKTSLLHSIHRHLLRLNDAEYDFHPIFIDLEGVPEESFFAILMSEILVQFEKRLGALPVRFQPTLPKRDYDSADFVHDLRLVVRKLRDATSKTPKLLLLLDEVDVLNTYSSRTNQRLRSVFMKTFGRHLGLVMAGVGIRKSWDSEGSPWYNFFEEIPVRPFSGEEARELICRPVEGVFAYAADAVELIVAACESRPYLIQRCCIACVNRASAEGRFRIGVEDVEAALSTVLGGRE